MPTRSRSTSPRATARTPACRAAQSTRGSGPGVTWNCAADAEIANQQTDCDPDVERRHFRPADRRAGAALQRPQRRGQLGRHRRRAGGRQRLADQEDLRAPARQGVLPLAGGRRPGPRAAPDPREVGRGQVPLAGRLVRLVMGSRRIGAAPPASPGRAAAARGDRDRPGLPDAAVRSRRRRIVRCGIGPYGHGRGRAAVGARRRGAARGGARGDRRADRRADHDPGRSRHGRPAGVRRSAARRRHSAPDRRAQADDGLPAFGRSRRAGASSGSLGLRRSAVRRPCGPAGRADPNAGQGQQGPADPNGEAASTAAAQLPGARDQGQGRAACGDPRSRPAAGRGGDRGAGRAARARSGPDRAPDRGDRARQHRRRGRRARVRGGARRCATSRCASRRCAACT